LFQLLSQYFWQLLKIAISMKSRIYPYLGLAFAVLLLLTSCNPNATSGGGSGDKVQLEMNLKPGLVYKMLTKTVQEVEQKVMGISTKTSSSTEMYIKNEVTAVDEQGVAAVKATYERVKTETENSMMGKQTFDSKSAPENVPMESRSYMAMIGRSIYFKVDKRGTVTEVSGIDSLFDAILSAVTDGQGGLEMETMKQTLKMTFGDEGMKSMMQSSSLQFPDVLVAEGDTWGKQIGSMANIPLNIDVTYKVDHIDGEKVVLSFDGKITSDKDKAMDLGLMQMQMDMSGDYEGTSELDRSTGLIIKTEVKQNMSGTMGAMGMNFPMTMKQTITTSRY
jgi:hypothetical protein